MTDKTEAVRTLIQGLAKHLGFENSEFDSEEFAHLLARSLDSTLAEIVESHGDGLGLDAYAALACNLDGNSGPDLAGRPARIGLNSLN